ncbi:MAG: DUF4366 domain-containing protein [Synergistaceae bacterium]|jgi:hypothetical protein|nr:DUF4366 domain-containing protein [Synergistaceae bacterium]
MTRNKFLISLFALTLVAGVLFFASPAYAADDPDPVPENLTVDAVWLDGDTLNIKVTDKQTGVHQTLELPIDEYAAGSEYVSVQAMDRSGNKSNTIQFKNPLYVPDAETDAEAPATQPEQSEPAVPDGWKPFTPDGAGTVIDDVTDGDGKEFFSIETEDGNVFYLIVDRQRGTDNVYLLNAATEDDLLSLAKDGDGKPESAVPAEAPPSEASQEPGQTPPSADSGGMNSGMIIFIAIAAAAASGAGYYFKILRPKKQTAGMIDEGEDDYDEDDYDEDDYNEDDDPGYGGGDYGDPDKDGDV